jgi:hypothetical protein
MRDGREDDTSAPCASSASASPAACARAPRHDDAPAEERRASEPCEPAGEPTTLPITRPPGRRQASRPHPLGQARDVATTLVCRAVVPRTTTAAGVSARGRARGARA